MGRLVAARRHSLLFGGGRLGMMGALAGAAAAGGARVTGIAPASVLSSQAFEPSAGELIVTRDLASRKAQMLARADLLIVLPGGLGTLDELFEMWTLGPQLNAHQVPLVLVNTHGFYDGLLAWLTSQAQDGMMHPRLISALQVVTSVEEAVAFVSS